MNKIIKIFSIVSILLLCSCKNKNVIPNYSVTDLDVFLFKNNVNDEKNRLDTYNDIYKIDIETNSYFLVSILTFESNNYKPLVYIQDFKINYDNTIIRLNRIFNNIEQNDEQYKYLIPQNVVFEIVFLKDEFYTSIKIDLYDFSKTIILDSGTLMNEYKNH